MRFAAWGGIAAAAFLSSAMALAQVPTSTADLRSRSTGPSAAEIAQSDRVLRDTVTCVIRYQHDRTRNLLDSIPGSHDEDNFLYSFRSRLETCYNDYQNGARALVYPTNLLRGAIAEAFYHDEFPSGLTAASADPEQLASWARARAPDGQPTQMEMLHAMARCVITRRPAAVATLLQATPMSPQELAAIRPLQPDLSACLDAGVEFTASRQSIRALLAEAALHYAESARSGFGHVGRTVAQAH